MSATRRTAKLREQLSTGNPGHGVDVTLITSEQWRANRSQLSHQETLRHEEEEWYMLSPFGDCLLDHMRTRCTWTPESLWHILPEIRLLCLHPLYTVYGHFLMLCFSLSQQVSAGASLTLPLPPDPEFLPIAWIG